MGNRSILLIESDHQLCLDLDTLLRKERWTPTSTSDSAVALEKIRSESFEILILDVRAAPNFITKVREILERKTNTPRPYILLTSWLTEVPEYKASQLIGVPLLMKADLSVQLIEILRTHSSATKAS